MIYRGRVTAVDAKGVYVLIGALSARPFLCAYMGSVPSVDNSVLVADCGSDACPDLVVIGVVA